MKAVKPDNRLPRVAARQLSWQLFCGLIASGALLAALPGAAQADAPVDAQADVQADVQADAPVGDEAFLLFLAEFEADDQGWISPVDFAGVEVPAGQYAGDDLDDAETE